MEHARARKQPTKGKVDLTYLQDLADGDENFVNEVITMFLNDAPDVLKQVMLYPQTENYQLLKTSVHKLKSSLRMLGNESISDIAQDIETLLHQHEPSPILLPMVMGFVAKTNQFLDSLRAELDTRMLKG